MGGVIIEIKQKEKYEPVAINLNAAIEGTETFKKYKQEPTWVMPDGTIFTVSFFINSNNVYFVQVFNYNMQTSAFNGQNEIDGEEEWNKTVKFANYIYQNIMQQAKELIKHNSSNTRR